MIPSTYSVSLYGTRVCPKQTLFLQLSEPLCLPRHFSHDTVRVVLFGIHILGIHDVFILFHTTFLRVIINRSLDSQERRLLAHAERVFLLIQVPLEDGHNVYVYISPNMTSFA